LLSSCAFNASKRGPNTEYWGSSQTQGVEQPYVRNEELDFLYDFLQATDVPVQYYESSSLRATDVPYNEPPSQATGVPDKKLNKEDFLLRSDAELEK